MNYGGFVYTVAWAALMVLICKKAFPRRLDALVVFGMVALAGFKGLVFSGNALIAVLLAFALLGGYRRDRQEREVKEIYHQHLYSVNGKQKGSNKLLAEPTKKM